MLTSRLDDDAGSFGRPGRSARAGSGPPKVVGVKGNRTYGGKGVRPYVATPMPAFGPEVAARLADAFEAADLDVHDDLVPAFSEEAMDVGRTLVGITGMACITCHDVAGKPSLGIPMVDLANTPERLRHDWFRRWLEDPVGMRPGTRMSAFFPDGKSVRHDILDGHAGQQIDAIWTYLSLGTAMPLPEGLVVDPSAYDLEPSGRPIHHACFWEGGSARGIAVGFPERKHYAFDQEHLRVDAMWYGAFVNAAHTWDGRAGGLVVPEGDGVLELPEGMAVAWLDAPDAEWPTANRRNLGWRYLGQSRNADDVPTWRYAKGEVVVEETLRPVFGPGGLFVRSFHFEGLPVQEGGSGYFLRLGAAEHIDWAKVLEFDGVVQVPPPLGNGESAEPVPGILVRGGMGLEGGDLALTLPGQGPLVDRPRVTDSQYPAWPSVGATELARRQREQSEASRQRMVVPIGSGYDLEADSEPFKGKVIILDGSRLVARVPAPGAVDELVLSLMPTPEGTLDVEVEYRW